MNKTVYILRQVFVSRIFGIKSRKPNVAGSLVRSEASNEEELHELILYAWNLQIRINFYFAAKIIFFSMPYLNRRRNWKKPESPQEQTSTETTQKSQENSTSLAAILNSSNVTIEDGRNLLDVD